MNKQTEDQKLWEVAKEAERTGKKIDTKVTLTYFIIGFLLIIMWLWFTIQDHQAFIISLAFVTILVLVAMLYDIRQDNKKLLNKVENLHKD